MKHRIERVAVLIPARNEEALLPRCIVSVLRAAAFVASAVKTDIVVVVDSSTDATYAIAEAMIGIHGHVIAADAGCVGATRALGAEAALRRYTGDPGRCWLANTDADCVVPETWLADQLRLAQQGAEAIAGTVDVDDFSEHLPGVEKRFRETYLLHVDGTHPHVHGANIGMRAAYLQAGGWSTHRTAEDHDLWNRLTLYGCRKRSVARLRVLTSGRRMGRAPDGFAHALAAHNEAVA